MQQLPGANRCRPQKPVTTRSNLGYSNDGCDHGAQAASGVEQVLVPHPCGSHDYLEFFDRGSVLGLFNVTGGLVMNLIPVGPRFLTGGVRYPVYPCSIIPFNVLHVLMFMLDIRIKLPHCFLKTRSTAYIIGYFRFIISNNLQVISPYA